MDLDSLYLDFNATSPLSTSVSDWLKSGDVIFGNPSSQHSSGKAARKTINESRAKIFATFNKNETETKLFFHSGATEGIMSVAYSFSVDARNAHKKLLICYSSIDHPAVTSLKDRFWGEHVEFFELKLKTDLSYDHESNLKSLRLKKQTDPDLLILYHHLWVHNETGFVSPLDKLTVFKQVPGLYLHIDAVQAPGKVLEWKKLSEGDIWTFSAHKFGALKGIGFTFIRESLPFHPLFVGGGQQQGLRGGTENPQGIKSIALALGDLEKVNVEATISIKSELVKFMESELKGIGEVLKSNAWNSNTIYFYLNHLASDIALALFDLNGLMLSAGSACSSGAAKPSLVLTELGKMDVAKNGLRISLPFQFGQEDLNYLKTRLLPVFNKLKSSK
ncbi:MAG TPA: aminotransferase class V-fold PLP-dependent enzyme [Bacteriovoracaceae bacterium]|nr:aminotransferase class V-fold PLP-dependent enzyme [Bacteriovoracaceae bacterium]